mgnify:FL=1
MIGGWEAEYGRGMKVFARGQSSMMKFWTNNWSQDMYRALQCAHSSFEYAPEPVEEGEPDPNNILLCADPRLVSHFRNAKRREKSWGYQIHKETPKSPHKIDACMAGVLAYAAREKYLGQFEDETPQRVMPQRVW